MQDAQVPLLNEVGEGVSVEESLLLSGNADDAAQTPFDQTVFSRARLFGGKPSLCSEAQTGEERRFFLVRETREGAEISKVGLELIVRGDSGRVCVHRT